MSIQIAEPMKENSPNTLATAINAEKMERILQRDKDEQDIEIRMDSLSTFQKSGKDKKAFDEEIRKISRKYYDIANVMVEDQQYSEAVELYSKSISILKKFAERKAVDSYFNRAITLAMLGYPNMAMDDLRAIENSKPPKPDIFFVKGQIFESMGKKKMAVRMYEKCLSVDPAFYRATDSLKTIADDF